MKIIDEYLHEFTPEESAAFDANMDELEIQVTNCLKMLRASKLNHYTSALYSEAIIELTKIFCREMEYATQGTYPYARKPLRVMTELWMKTWFKIDYDILTPNKIRGVATGNGDFMIPEEEGQ